jgi:hypothetical protein
VLKGDAIGDYLEGVIPRRAAFGNLAAEAEGRAELSSSSLIAAPHGQSARSAKHDSSLLLLKPKGGAVFDTARMVIVGLILAAGVLALVVVGMFGIGGAGYLKVPRRSPLFPASGGAYQPPPSDAALLTQPLAPADPVPQR